MNEGRIMMSLYRLLTVLILSGMTLIASAAGIPISNPARVEDVQEILRIFAFDQKIKTAIRREVENSNNTKPETYLDPEIYLRPFTVEAINLRMSVVVSKYISNDYAQKLLKDLSKPIGKISTRIDREEMNRGSDVAKSEFMKLSPADRKAVNDFRSSANYLSFLNALKNSTDERKEMVGQWAKEEMQGRANLARKVIAEMTAQYLKAEQEDKMESLNPSDRIPLTGLRYFDQEARLTYEYLRANIKQSKKYSEEIKSLDLAKVLKAESLTTRQGLENSNLTVLSAENIFSNNTKHFESLRTAYGEASQRIVMPQQQREEIIAGNKSSTERIFDLQIRHDEQLRIFLELVKQVLSLCENRFGKIKFVDNTLHFETDADLKQYNDLIKRINVTVQAIKDLEKEDLEYRTQALETFKKK
ncbi:hypothetical protein [Undibacterium pigrum]|nr:hypothetical protein [Undibacterium pigrum]